MIEILTISSGKTQCGICEYAKHLQAALPGDLLMRGVQRGEWLDPQQFFAELPAIQEYRGPQVVWLNYHAALHSRWTPEQVARLHAVGLPVVITYHDTGVPNSEQCRRLWQTQQLAEGGSQPFVVHEPCDDLPGAIYLRQGVPGWQPPYTYRIGTGLPADDVPAFYWLGLNNRPILGTVGFPFPWKNYDLLARATALAGWSLLLLAPDLYEGGKPDALHSQVEAWQALNPWTAVVSAFIPADEVLRYLGMCDATAFLYMCANTGTSGAIRQGIAARKPVLATAGCRQFRDLELDPLGRLAIDWLEDLSPEGVARALECIPIERVHPPIHRIAERDSWTHQAARYAEIFRSLVR